MSSRAMPASAITSIAASASHPPRSKLSRQYSEGAPAPSAAVSRVRWALVYARDVWARRSTSMRPSLASRKRATAALIPSREVPDIKPTTTPDDILRVSDGRRRIPGDAPDHAAVFGEELLGFLTRDSLLLHHDRKLDALVRALEELRRFISRHSADFHHNSLAPVDELVVRRAEVDHQIAVRLAEPDHGAGRDGIEHELGRGPGFHPRRASDDLGADDRKHRQVDFRHEVGGRRRACDDSGFGAESGGALEGRAHVRRRARGRDPDYEVLLVHAVLVHRERAILDDVLRSFLRPRQGRKSAGDYAQHHFRFGAEGRWTLACVEHSQSS